MPRYEVQTETLCDGWVNCWMTYDEHNNMIPTIYDTREEAEAELAEYIEEMNFAVECGDVIDFDPETLRIAEVYDA